MHDQAPHIVTINAGSSSIKVAIFTSSATPEKLIEAVIENIGQPKNHLFVTPATGDTTTSPIDAHDYDSASRSLTEWVRQHLAGRPISAICHRLVHGGPHYTRPQRITDHFMTELRNTIIFDPIHLPAETRLIDSFAQQFPDVTQVACFDTAFHRDLPNRAKLFAIPRQFADEGVHRYGFHGLSYAYILDTLQQLGDPAATSGRVIIAHLGSGASLAAIQNGKSIDTTMGLTPAAGIPMSTRSGDLDPGINLYLQKRYGYDAARINYMTNFESGLLGVSGSSGDMKQLLDSANTDRHAEDAVELFCYHVKKTIGAYAAAMGGLNTLVFTGGMGEHAPKIRTRICDGLQFLGIALTDSQNSTNAAVISVADAPVTIRVMRTDEATTMAREAVTLVNQGDK